MKRIFNLLALMAVVTAMAGCVTPVRERVIIHDQPQKTVVRQMPAPIQESVPVQPGPGYAWVPGHWVWRDTGWQWQAGHWYSGAVRPMPPIIVEQVTIAPSPSHFWVQGHWKWHGSDWIWVKGRWER